VFEGYVGILAKKDANDRQIIGYILYVDHENVDKCAESLEAYMIATKILINVESKTLHTGWNVA
jgi:hypothetical protein